MDPHQGGAVIVGIRVGTVAHERRAHIALAIRVGAEFKGGGLEIGPEEIC
ncbi:hypothetical protein GCM10009604_13980 [Corynebacterium aurimucosum]